MWNHDTLTLYGERKIQTFNIHTGSRSNSKSTKISLQLVNTLLKSMQKNSKGLPILLMPQVHYILQKGKDLHSSMNQKRMLIIIASWTVEEMANGYKSTLKARGCYVDSIEFLIFFQVERCLQ